jgi:predicted nucleic acid-binding protein
MLDKKIAALSSQLMEMKDQKEYQRNLEQLEILQEKRKHIIENPQILGKVKKRTKKPKINSESLLERTFSETEVTLSFMETLNAGMVEYANYRLAIPRALQVACVESSFRFSPQKTAIQIVPSAAFQPKTKTNS